MLVFGALIQGLMVTFNMYLQKWLDTTNGNFALTNVTKKMLCTLTNAM